MRGRKILAIIILCLLIIGFPIFSVTMVSADPVFKQITGVVDPNSTTGVRAYDPVQNGFVYYYIQNRTNEGSGTDPMETNPTPPPVVDFYDPDISIGINDWQLGDECILVVDREYGNYSTNDHAGYIAFINVTLDPSGGVQFAPTIELQKITTPTFLSNGTGYIEITWDPLNDTNGLIEGYKIYRSTTNGSVGGDADWVLVGGSVNAPLNVTNFNDTSVTGGNTYYYSVKVVFTGYQNDDPAQVDNYQNQYFGEGSAPMSSSATTLTVDYINLTTGSTPNGSLLINEVLDVGGQVQIWASGYNESTSPHSYVPIPVGVNWSQSIALGSFSTYLGWTTIFTAGYYQGGITTITGENFTMIPPVIDTGDITINPPTVDYILLTYSPNGTEIPDMPWNVGNPFLIYASGYNNTASTYVDIVDVNWTDTPDLGDFDNSTGTSSTFNGTAGGLTTIKGEYIPIISDTFQLDLIPPTVDYILIRDEPGGVGNIVTTMTYSVYQQDQFYAAAYNNTTGYISDVEVVWESDATSVGTVTTPGIWTNFTAQWVNVNSTCTVTATYQGFIIDTTGMLTVLAPTVDFIKIRTQDNGGGIDLCDPVNWPTYQMGTQTTFYGAEYNNTVGFIGSVPLTSTWTSNNTGIVTVTSPGNSTLVNCSSVNSGWVWVTLNNSMGHSNLTGITVSNWTVDYILIRDAPSGGGLNLCDPANYTSFPVGEVVTYYGAAYNYSVGYFKDVDPLSTWVTTDGTIVAVESQPSGSSCMLICSNTNWGTVTITLTDDGSGKQNITQVTVLEPLVDYILIRDSPGGLGNEITTATYCVWETDNFYAAAYNNTASYLYDVEVEWSSDNPSVGQVISPGIWTNFTAQWVNVDSTCTVTATYGSINGSTGLLTVLAPKVNYILIRDSPGGGGNNVTTGIYSVWEVDYFYAAGYNSTVGYLKDVKVAWSCDDPSVGNVTTPGTWTNFTAQWVLVDSTCTVTAVYSGNITDSTGLLTVLAPKLDYILLTDSPNGAEIVDMSLEVGNPLVIYASGYNNTGSIYIGLVDVNWTDIPDLGDFDNPTGTSSTFTGTSVGLTTLKGENITLGVSDDFQLNLLPPPANVDYIIITDSPNGSALSTVTLPVGGLVLAYASGYNISSGYVDLVNVNWSESAGLGSFDNLTGTSTTFTAGVSPGITTITGQNLTLGVSDIFTVNISPATVDFIYITDSPNGTALTTIILNSGEQVTAYASGYNSTSGYLGLVEVNWSESAGLGSFDNLTGTSTAFTAGILSGLTTITGENLTLGVIDTFDVNINPPTIDFIIITDAPNGSERTSVSLPIGGQITAYASGYNISSGYVSLVEVNWSGSGGIWSPSTGTSSTFTAGNVTGKFIQTAQNISLGLSDIFDISIVEVTLDYIVITDAPNGTQLITVVLDAGGQITAYASGYNMTYMWYIGLIEVNWSESAGLGSFDNLTGTSTTFTAGFIGGLTTVMGQNIALGVSDIFNVNINPPTIDFILLTNSPNGSEIADMSWSVGDPLLIYASGYNNTGPTYVGLVFVTWTDTPDLGDFDNSTGTSSTFTGISEGLTIIKGENATMSDTFQFNLFLPIPLVDYLILTDSPNGTTLSLVNLSVGDQITVYASGYNATSGYIGLVEVDWSESAGLGSFNNLTGTSSTFTAGFMGGSTMITGENLTLGISDSFDVYIVPPTIDDIILTDTPNGTALNTVTLNVGDGVLSYASGYNTTSGYVGLVDVNWSESGGLGSFNNLTGTSIIFIAGFAGGSTTITGENTTLVLSDTFDVNINPPSVDYIQIRTQSGGGGLNLCDPGNYTSYPVGAFDIYYGALYNHTAGYFADVPGNATWLSSVPSIVTVTSPGSSSNIKCDDHNWGLVTITLSAEGKQNITQVTVVEPIVDYIQIRDESNGMGSIVTTRTYIVWQKVEFYAAAYNYTAEYIGEVEAVWWSNDNSVGKVTSPGLWTNFTAQKVDHDGICFVTAEFNGIQNSTGTLTVLAPTIDFIAIRDSPNGLGKPVLDMTYNEGDKDFYWAAGYNITADYIKDVKATWESNNTIVGKVTYGPNEYTDFTAGWRGGYCKITAIFGTLSNKTGTLFVINVNQLPTANGDYYNETGFTGGNFSFSIDITLRVTGRKQNVITMGLEEDGIIVQEVTVVRQSGQPDIGIISYDMDAHKVYRVILNYYGNNGGSNPIIVTFEFLGNVYSVHLLFNSEHGAQQTAIIEFNDVLPLVGVIFFDGFKSTDFEGYLVDYEWDFGDSTTGNGETLAHTYEGNGIYTVTLKVTDDEGGTDETTITVAIDGIDNNNQANAILGQKAAKGYLNGSGQYVVVLQCPANLLITNLDNRHIGYFDKSQINNIDGAFIAMLFSDVEVYYIPEDTMYIFEVNGLGSGSYNLSVIDVKNDVVKKYNFYNVTCSDITLDTYIINFVDNKISLSTKEDDKHYSLELLTIILDHSDRFYLTNMKLNINAVHIYKINNWERLSSNEPVTLSVDENNDGIPDKLANLESGLNGDEINALLLRKPVGEPVFPLLLFVIVGCVCAIGAVGIMTEVGKWGLLILFLPLYTRIKKEELLDQPTRYKIYGYIIGNPGAHFGLIKAELELGSGQLVYHLRQLQKADLIYSREDGVKKRFYPAHVPKMRRGIPHISDIQEKILGIIKNNSGISQKKVASSVGISRQVAGYHLAIMEEKGVIKKEVVGRNAKYYPC